MKVQRLVAVSLVILCGAASGMYASPADPKQPKLGAAVRPPPPPLPPLPGIYSATVRPDVTHPVPYGIPPKCGTSPPTGNYIYYYPGPGRSGALMVQEEPRNGQGGIRVYWDPNFYNPLENGGVTPWHPNPWDPYPVAWLPVNSADPALFQPYPYGFRGSEIKTTFASPTRFKLEGIWGWNTEVCYRTVDLVRIGCDGNHTTDWNVSPGGDGRAECQKYCALIPDGPAEWASSAAAVKRWKCGRGGVPTVVRAKDANQPGTLTNCPCVVLPNP